uniref:Mlh1_C domain-containing protein n=1 Tax=Panagrellus redivivus TaxID=6233 RepID=A0A7E4ZXE8_PANRE
MTDIVKKQTAKLKMLNISTLNSLADEWSIDEFVTFFVKQDDNFHLLIEVEGEYYNSIIIFLSKRFQRMKVPPTSGRSIVIILPTSPEVWCLPISAINEPAAKKSKNMMDNFFDASFNE